MELGQGLFLGSEPVQLIQNNNFVSANPSTPFLWTPADFTNVDAWWKADSGVTMSTVDSSRVQRWTDTINGYEVTQSFNTNPQFTAVERSATTASAWTNLNNQPIVRFGMTTNANFTNAPQYMYTTGSFPALSSESFTQIIICDYITRGNAGDTFTAPIIGMTDQSSAKRFFFDRQNSDGDVRNNTGLGAATLQSVDTNINLPNDTVAVMWSQYQASSADTYFALNSTTGSLTYNGTVTNDTWAATTLFAINGFMAGTSNVGSIIFTRAQDMAVAEVILIYGEPSAGEWAQFKTYVSNRYGLTIS
jgi:hypothetical protein